MNAKLASRGETTSALSKSWKVSWAVVHRSSNGIALCSEMYHSRAERIQLKRFQSLVLTLVQTFWTAPHRYWTAGIRSTSEFVLRKFKKDCLMSVFLYLSSGAKGAMRRS